MNENKEIINTNNQLVDFISLDEASQQLRTTYSSLVKWLNQNKEIKEKYCFKAKYQGRRRTLIYVEALLVIANVKNTTYQGNRFEKMVDPTINQNTEKGKQKLAESTIEQVKTSQSLESLYSQAQMMVKTLEQLMQISGKVEDHEERILQLEGDPELTPITNGQKKTLSEFCNRLHFELEKQSLNIHFSQIRKDLNIAVGRKTVNEYTQADYFRSIAILKRWYKQHDIQF